MLYGSFILLILIAFTKCENTEKSPTYFSDSFTQFDEIRVKRVELYNGFLINPVKMKYHQSGNFIVTTTTPDWGIYLLSQEGAVISSFKNNTGNGPGEVVVINDIYLSSENDIFILDKMSNEFEVYSIKEDTLLFKKTIILPNYYPFSLKYYFENEDQKFAIFQDLSKKFDLKKMDSLMSEYSLYALNDDYSLKTEIGRIPGDELIEGFRAGTVMSNPIGYRTTWDIDKNELYYGVNNNFDLNAIDLNLLANNKVSYNGPEKRWLSDFERDSIENKFSLFIERLSSFKINLEKRNNLPFYYEFAVSNDMAYYQIQNYSTSNELIIEFDMVSGKKRTITAPGGFTLRGATSNFIYGIEFKNNKATPVVFLFGNGSE